MRNPMRSVGLELLRRHWLGFMVLGLCLILLGLMALTFTQLFTEAVVTVCGWLLIVGGLLEAAYGFWRKGLTGFFLDLVTGLLYVVAGLLIVINPVTAAEFLTLVIAVALIVNGVFRAVAAIQGKFEHRLWLLAHGLLSVLLGISIWSSWPLSGRWVIGLFVGIDLLFNGITLVMLALAARRRPLWKL